MTPPARAGAGTRNGPSTSLAEHCDPVLTRDQVQELPAGEMLASPRPAAAQAHADHSHKHKEYKGPKLDPNPTLRG